MNILIVDTETTGLDPDTSRIIEIAAILFNVESRTVLQQMSTLVPVLSNPQQHINKIDHEVSMTAKYPLETSINHLVQLLFNADFIVAHNADFDKKFLEHDKVTKDIFVDGRWKWLCSQMDFEWPIALPGGKSLVNIAVSMGVPVVSAHRALADCQLLASCFEKIEDLESRIQKASIERFLYKALVGYEDREKAKEHGFVWDRVLPKAWGKKMTEDEAREFSHFKIAKVSVNTN